jgi:hypothetical protein
VVHDTRVVESRKLRWAGYESDRRWRYLHSEFWQVNLLEIGNFEDLGGDGRIDFEIFRREIY